MTIKSIVKETKEKEDGVIQGIAKRYFSKSFTIVDDVESKAFMS